MSKQRPSDEYLQSRMAYLESDFGKYVCFNKDSLHIDKNRLLCKLCFDFYDGEIDFAFGQLIVDFDTWQFKLCNMKLFKSGRNHFDEYEDDDDSDWRPIFHKSLADYIISNHWTDDGMMQ